MVGIDCLKALRSRSNHRTRRSRGSLNSFAFFFLSQEAPCWIPTEIFPEAERARVELKVTGGEDGPSMARGSDSTEKM
jgi:hypothetical protein